MIAPVSDSIYRSDSIAPADSVAADSVAAEPRFGIVLQAEPESGSLPRPESADAGMSWVVGTLMVIFLIVAIRYRSNTKYAKALVREMLGVRERGNVFDDTVRETSFLVLLNLMWVCSGGVLFGALVGAPATPAGIGISAGIVAAYTLFMLTAYYIIGNVFSDARHASMWVRGFAAGQGIGSLAVFPLALLHICYPSMTEIWLMIAGGVLFLIKIVFIWKGFRIFFTQTASWLLFLYYLCSLEIVPLILTYVAACHIFSNLL